jgi:hypothetical protein
MGPPIHKQRLLSDAECQKKQPRYQIKAEIHINPTQIPSITYPILTMQYKKTQVFRLFLGHPVHSI